MKVTRCTPFQFLGQARAFLERAEVENTLILSNAMSLEAGAMTLSATPILAVAEDGAEMTLAALRTPPHRLAISDGPEPAILALAAALVEWGCALPGVIGPSRAAGTFAKAWSEAAELDMRQLVYRCSAVRDLPPPPGRPRLATAADAPVLAGFVQAFDGATAPDRAPPRLLRRIADDSVLVWEDGEVVSMAWTEGPTTNGIRVSGVYTPPEHRKRGYARGCVSSLTRRELEAGRRFCCLFTNADDPTANALYQRIGYERVCESASWRFP